MTSSSLISHQELSAFLSPESLDQTNCVNGDTDTRTNSLSSEAFMVLVSAVDKDIYGLSGQTHYQTWPTSVAVIFPVVSVGGEKNVGRSLLPCSR